MNPQPYRWVAPSNFDQVLEQIREAAGRKTALDEIFRLLVEYQPLLNYRCGRGSIYWRGRKCTTEAGFANAREVGPPCPAITGVNRLNDPGSPVLYAATRTHTVFNELHLVEGDYVHLIGIRVRPNAAFHIMAVGELSHIFKTGRSRVLGDDVATHLSRMLNDTAANLARRLIYVDALLDSHLGDPDAGRDDYLHTRAIARAILAKVEQIEAFFYPSVRHEAGLNFAVMPDTFKTKMHIVSSQVVRILRRRDVGLFDYEVCRQAIDLDHDGTFTWSVNVDDLCHKTIIFEMTKEEAEFSGARNNRLTGNDYLELITISSSNSTGAKKGGQS